MSQSVTNFFDFWLNILFPPCCVGCGKLNHLLCQQCYGKIDFYIWPVDLKLEKIYLDEIVICAHFSSPISKLIKVMKYQQFRAIGSWLGELLYVSCKFAECDFIVPIPMHQRKKNERGFNQTEEIALRFSELVGKKMIVALIKKSHSVAQASIKNQIERKKRVAGFFSLNPKYFEQIQGKKLLLIDDVCTTGSTLNEAAKVLKAAGAKWVGGLAVAKK